VTTFGLKSANDCPDRDPSNLKLFGITGYGEKRLLHSIEGLIFEDRFLWKYIQTNNDQAFSQYEILITANVMYATTGSWGSGTQLAEVMLLEIGKNNFKDD